MATILATHPEARPQVKAAKAGNANAKSGKGKGKGKAKKKAE